MRFSKVMQTFYPSDIQYMSLPVDIVNVTQVDFNLAMTRTSGQTLDLINGAVVIVPAPPPTLAQAQAAQISALVTSYQAAIAVPVSFKSAAGLTQTFQSDAESVANVQATLAGLAKTAATPSGFYWVASDNTQVPFSYADVQGLAAAMLAQGWAAFQHLQTQKNSVLDATTVLSVQSITW